MNTSVFYESVGYMIQPLAMATPPGGKGQPGITSFLPMLLMLMAIFYLLVFRPQQKKQKDQKKMIASIQKGDRVVTAGGIHGLVAGVKENIVLVKVADNVKIEVTKGSIAAVVKKEGATE